MYEEYLNYGNGTSSSIFIAALTSDTKYILKYYQAGSSITVKDDRDQSLLHLAARNKALKSAELLLKLGLNPNIGDKYNETPLHIASHMGNIEMVELLLEYDADPNYQNNALQTPLHRAAFKGTVEVLKRLLDHHADIYMLDERHASVMMYAVRSKKIKAIKFLIERGAIINSIDLKGDSILHYAAQYSTVDIVKFLLDSGVNPYCKNQYLETPLHIAVEHPQIEMVETLLDSGLTSYDQSKFDISPYDVANMKSAFEAVELFNKLKNDHVYQSKVRKNPLTFAIIMNQHDKASSLIEISDVNERDIFNNTPLFYAIMNQEEYLVEKLLRYNASIYNIDNKSDDALYYACLTGNINIVKLVQQKQVDYNKKYGGYTVLEYALKLQNDPLYRQLKKGLEN